MSTTLDHASEPEHADGAGPAPDHLTRRSFVARTATVAAVAGTIGAGAAASSAVAAPKAPRASLRSASGPSALPSVASAKAGDRELVDHEVVELAALLQAGEISSVELTQAYIDRIKAYNGAFENYAEYGNGAAGYNAFVRIDEAGALASARVADQRLSAARAGGAAAPFLCGIPMGFKDSIGTGGFKQQNGTTAFAGNVAIEDSTPVGRLRSQGVVAIGITIASAFSGSISGTFTGNAWDLNYAPGGSSQGSGCAPIARLAAACLGEETGGSIIFPAASNGASAIKPSLGLGSTSGVMPLSPSYDVVGPIARSGRDAALIMSTIAGPDPLGDPNTLFAPIPFPTIPLVPRLGAKPLAGLTFGVNKTDWLTTSEGGTATAQTRQGVDPQSLYDAPHAAAFDRVIGELRALGAEVKDFNGADFLVYSETENPFYNNPDVLQVVDGSPISPSAAVINPNRYDIRYSDAVKDFAADKPDDQRTALLGSYGRRAGGASATSGVPLTFEAATALNGGVTAATRAEGERRRRQWAANYKQKMVDAGVDIMLVMSLGGKPARRLPVAGNYPVRRNNQLANSLSFPMVSFPVGYDPEGLPMNVELKGPRFSEPALTQVMVDYQARFPDYNAARPANPTLSRSRAAEPSAAAIKAARDLAADPMLSTDPLIHEA